MPALPQPQPQSARDIEAMRDLEARARLSATTRLALGRSRIDGTGVFALADMRADEVVGEYAGELVSDGECERRERAYERIGLADYMFRVAEAGAGCVCDATLLGARTRYINPPCEPSLYAVNPLAAGGARRVFFYAARRIRRGEELSYDYSFPSDEAPILCRCGAPTCRGTLNAAPES